jgi:glucan-binding YG repeat protein
MKKQTRFFAVMSAAAFMSMLPYGAAYAAQSGWTEEDGAMVYYDEDGYLTTDSWRKNGDDWYFLDEDGQITINQKVEDFYVGSDGKMVKNTWIELRNEEDIDSPETPASFWYYFEKDGKAAASKWLKLDSKWYYFNDAGQMQTGKTAVGSSTYYFGDDGAMKTGWLKLDDGAAVPGASDSWYYFESDGKMVENHVDKKINGAYYTFVNGRMQTGWILIDKEEAGTSSETASNAAETKAPSVGAYQYYGEEGDGKRAEGWRTIEGVEGIHDMDETYTFYFKDGRSYFSETAGNQLFTVDAKKYAFNERGEMQTGKQSVNIGDGKTANFYFDENGVMKTGKQNIYNEETGETESWYFYTDGEQKGQGYHGLRDNTLYINGKRQEASSDVRYAPVEFEGSRYLVNTTGSVQKASSSSTSSVKPELGRGFKDFKDANGTIWVVDTNGILQ